nr:helix-turn-helix domain-containing protein [Chromobacterium sp. ASV5]
MQQILVPKVTLPQALRELIVTELSVTLPVMEDKQAILEAFSRRVDVVCDRLGIPPAGKNRQYELGKRFGVSQKAARKWLVAEGFPDTAISIKMAVEAGVSFDWLMTGRGPMEVAEYSEPGDDLPVARRAVFTADGQPVGLHGEDLAQLKQTLEAALQVIEKAAKN